MPDRTGVACRNNRPAGNEAGRDEDDSSPPALASHRSHPPIVTRCTTSRPHPSRDQQEMITATAATNRAQLHA